MTDEFRQRFAGRYFGLFRGIVTRVEDDPSKLVRIMARVPVVLGVEDDVGWAWPAGGGGSESGKVWPPQINDIVWIEFEEGDPQRPVWSHGPWGMRDQASMLPKHARGERDAVDDQIRSVGIIPASSFAGTYPNVRIQKSPSGHFLEFDDTENQERVQLAHKDGTRVEMLADGSAEFVTKDDLRAYVSEALQLEVVRALTALIHEDATVESRQTLTLKSASGEVELGLGSPSVKIGGPTASEPFIKGNQWEALMASLITLLSTHTHAGPGTVPVEAAAFTAFLGQLASVLSTYIAGR